MSELTIKILRLACTRPTDSLAEGTTDEVGWRLIAKNEAGDRSMTREEIPVPRLVGVGAGADVKLDRELPPLGPQWRTVVLEFWDKDSFSKDDLLGRIQIERKAGTAPEVAALETAVSLREGRFRLTGAGGDYMVWLSFTEA
jgi:hypothetical protein